MFVNLIIADNSIFNNKHMIMKTHLYSIILLAFATPLFSQSGEKSVEAALKNYIEATSYNNVERIEKAFYPEANLYLEKSDKKLWIVPISEYSSWFEKGTKGQFNGRVGRIISIDQFNNIAVAKAEVLIPKKNLRYIDMFLMKKEQNEWRIISKTASRETSNKKGNRILFIVSNAHYYGDSMLATGNSFSEIVNAYDTFDKAGYTVDFVSPNGGSIPLAYINTSDSIQKKYLYDQDFMFALKSTKQPKDVAPENYQAVHYIGGGSAMFGVPDNKEIQELSMTIYEKHNGIVSSVCHGTAGIVNLKTEDGKYLVDGKSINGYPDSYENSSKAYFKEFPFLIQKTIEERGGTFNFSPRNSPHVEVNGNLITGQNYLSSRPVALKIIEILESRN